MGNKSVVKKKELRRAAAEIIEQAVFDEPTRELVERLEDICCTCRETHCKQPFEREDRVLLNTCEKWCPGICAALALVHEQLWRIEWAEIESKYGRDWL